MDCGRIHRTVYEVQQHFRYSYAAPICDLRQRLVVVPRSVHGDQRVLSHRLEMSQPHSRKRMRVDRFGNVNFEISIPKVEEAVDFDVSLIVERLPGQGPHVEAATQQALERLPTAIGSHPAGHRAARRGRQACLQRRAGAELAIAVGGWVYRQMSYGFDRTDVTTTASQALAAGQGVCQDYAHLMLALCRLLGIPARYVSGYLVGEGGTHAWVEVLQPLTRRRGRDPRMGPDTRSAGRPPLPHRCRRPRLPRRCARLRHLLRAARGAALDGPPRERCPHRARGRRLTCRARRETRNSANRVSAYPGRTKTARSFRGLDAARRDLQTKGWRAWLTPSCGGGFSGLV